MTNPPEYPDDQNPAAPPPYGPPSGSTPPPGGPYPSAPPISEAYGPPGGTATYAGRWRRLFAAIIDGIIIGVIGSIIAIPLIGTTALYSSGSHDMGPRLASNGLTTLVALVYFVVLHGRWGQTLGKRALQIRVVRAADGGPIGYGTAAWRLVFAYLISIVTCGVAGLVDVAWILWDDRRQALHDKVAKTVVVPVVPGAPDPYATP